MNDATSEAKPTYTATEPAKCMHGNGWYVVVPFWIFRKKIFVCSDCGSTIAK